MPQRGAAARLRQRPEADPETNWISRMLKAVGVEHESHVAAKLDERGNPMPMRQQATDDSFSLISTNAPDQQGRHRQASYRNTEKSAASAYSI